MGCKPVVWTGLDSCEKLWDKVAALIATDIGTVFTDAEFISETKLHEILAAIATGMSGNVLDIRRGYENNTADPVVEESNLGISEITDNPLPQLVGYLQVSLAEQQALLQIDAQSFDFPLQLKDGTRIGTMKSDGTIKGLRGKIYIRRNLPMADTKQQSYKIFVFFSSIREFENLVSADSEQSVDDIRMLVPVGLSQTITVPYIIGTGIIRVKVLKRGSGTPLLGLTATDFTIIKTNASDPGVTAATEIGFGEYDLTVEKDIGTTPVPFVLLEYADIQATDDDVTYYIYASNLIKAQP